MSYTEDIQHFVEKVFSLHVRWTKVRVTVNCKFSSFLHMFHVGVGEAMEVFRVCWGRSSTVVAVVAAICLFFLIVHKTRDPGGRSLVEIFAARRARLMYFCQKSKISSNPPSGPLFLSYIKNLPGDTLINFLLLTF